MSDAFLARFEISKPGGPPYCCHRARPRGAWQTLSPMGRCERAARPRWVRRRIAPAG